MEKSKIGAMVFIGSMLFFAGPYALTLSIITEGVSSWILTGFTYAAWSVAVFLIYRVIKAWDIEKQTIEPKTVFISCAVFLMLYVTTSSFR